MLFGDLFEKDEDCRQGVGFAVLHKECKLQVGIEMSKISVSCACRGGDFNIELPGKEPKTKI